MQTAAIPDTEAGQFDLLQRLELLELMLANTTDVVLVIDPAGRIKAATESFGRVLGYTKGHDIVTAIALVHPDDRAIATRELKAAVAGARGDDPFTIRVMTANGSIRPMECTAVNHLGRPQIGGVVVTMRDVSERHMFSQMLRFQATHDRLTELPNRTLLEEHVRPALARAARERSLVAVCYFDMRGFGELNEQLGRAAGDELLIDVARRILSSVRSGDSVARLGDDEFAVLLDPVDDATEARAVAERIVASISGPHSLRAGVSDCGANAGVAVSSPTDDASGIIARADRALSVARRRGSGAVELAAQPVRAEDMTRSADQPL